MNSNQVSYYFCPECHNQFVQPFVCTTCGAEKLYDETVRSQGATIERLQRELVAEKERADYAWKNTREIDKERMRLREALERIANEQVVWGMGEAFQKIARQALAHEPIDSRSLRKQIDQFRTDTAHLPPLSGEPGPEYQPLDEDGKPVKP